MKIIILGASGLIGNSIKSVFEKNRSIRLLGTFCNNTYFNKNPKQNLYRFNVLSDDSIYDFIYEEKPDLIINCLGITKHLKDQFSEDNFIKVNSSFPKYISSLATEIESRFIHISTDCVYDGKKGNYSEKDIPDANDIYGLSKIEAESVKKNNLVLRTSTVGKEINTQYGLLEWFLNQKEDCEGYKNAIFSGITAVELGKIIRDYFLLTPNIRGLYNIGSTKINKYDLLQKFAKFYGKKIKINENIKVVIDRSLNTSNFRKKFDYKIKSWEKMLSEI